MGLHDLDEKNFIRGIGTSFIGFILSLFFSLSTHQRIGQELLKSGGIASVGIILGVIIFLIPGFISLIITKNYGSFMAGTVLGIFVFSSVAARAMASNLVQGLKLAAVMITCVFILLIFLFLIKLAVIKCYRFFNPS